VVVGAIQVQRVEVSISIDLDRLLHLDNVDPITLRLSDCIVVCISSARLSAAAPPGPISLAPRLREVSERLVERLRAISATPLSPIL
jgi:hypothetical protein